MFFNGCSDGIIFCPAAGKQGCAMTTEGNKLKISTGKYRSAALHNQMAECTARSIQSVRMDFSKSSVQKHTIG